MKREKRIKQLNHIQKKKLAKSYFKAEKKSTEKKKQTD